MGLGPAVAIPAGEEVRSGLLSSSSRTRQLLCVSCVCGCVCLIAAVGVDPAIMGVGPAVAIPAAVEKVREGLLPDSLFDFAL
jgi:hypothetical protein